MSMQALEGRRPGVSGAFVAPADAVSTLPSWPAASIALLALAAVMMPPGAMTAANAYLVVLAALVWLARGVPMPVPVIVVCGTTAAAVLVGLLGGIGNDTYAYLKDAWYFVNPLLVILVGFVLYQAMPSPERGLRAFVIGGVLVSSFHMLFFVFRPELVLRSAVEIRSAAGTGYYAPVLAIVVLLAHARDWRGTLRLSPLLAWPALALCLLSAVLSFSRTIAVLLPLMLLLAWFGLRRRTLLIALLLAGLLSLGMLSVREAVESGAVDPQRSFVGKLARSVEELTVDQYWSMRAINENWRGYETAQALRQYADGHPLQWVFGQGFGTEVDMGVFMNLSGRPGSAVRFIPILHNGFVYVLVKTGIAGLGLFLGMLGYLLAMGLRAVRAIDGTGAPARAGRLLQAMVLGLAFTTYIVSGAFNKFDLFPLTLAAGFLLAVVADRRADARVDTQDAARD